MITIHYNYTDGTELSYIEGLSKSINFNTNCLDFFCFDTLDDVLVIKKNLDYILMSELLFDKGSAEMGSSGLVQVKALARVLRQIGQKIPAKIDWVLRVDGHTDDDPITTPSFPSNWELSTARAIAVVRQLVVEGVSPKRLVAAGFGQFHPLDTRNDEIAKRRNRRIELKLTQR